MLVRVRKSCARKIGDEREEGFTLIELLVVMIIIGILAAIAIPVFLYQRNSGYDATTKSDVKNASTAEETYFTDNGKYTDNTGTSAAAGTATGPLTGWIDSASTGTVTFTVATGGASYMIVAVSKSTKSFCFNSLNSGRGVIQASTC